MWKAVNGLVRGWLVACLVTGITSPVKAATYYVDVNQGSDKYTPIQAQNPATPWRTLTQAANYKALTRGDTVEVAPGVYDEPGGENFPLPLKDGVTIRGAGEELTVIYCGYGGQRSTGRSESGAIFETRDSALGSDTWLTGLTLDSNVSCDGIDLEANTVAMAPHISEVGFGQGLYEGLNVSGYLQGDASFTGLLENNTFSNNSTAVSISMSGSESKGQADISPVIRGNQFGNYGDATYFYVYGRLSGQLSPVMEDNDFAGVEQAAEVYAYLYGGDFAIRPLFSGNTVSGGNSGNDLQFSISASLSSSTNTLTFSPTITNNSFSGSDYSAINISELRNYYGKTTSHLTIAGNTISGSQGSAIGLSASTMSGDIDFDWTITNNTISAPDGNGISLSLSELSDATGKLNVTIAGNTITRASSAGIYLYESSMGKLDQKLLLAGNTITDSSGAGLSLSLYSQSALQSNSVRLIDNILQQNHNNGLYMANYGSKTNAVTVSGNTITGNSDAGISLSNSSSSTVPDLGGGNLKSPGLNTFLNNGDNSYDIYTESRNPLSAQHNYWGTSDAEEIDARVYDNDENTYTGAADLSNPLTAQPRAAATGSITAAVSKDTGLSGPTPGDTIHYTATLQGTGTIGCASATLHVDKPENVTFVEGSVATSKGLVQGLRDGLDVGLTWLGAGDSITVGWDMTVGANAACAPIELNATLSCTQLGAVKLTGPGTTVVMSSATYYTDSDNDGFGDSSTATTVCTSVPAQSALQGGDCDDANKAIAPGATEVVGDGIDQDCDGQESCYADADGDGRRADKTSTVGSDDADCSDLGEALTGAPTDDCDDTHADVHPGAAEIAGDGVDQDCDGQEICYVDGDGDSFRTDATTSSSDLTCKTKGQAPASVSSGDCNDSSKSVYPGAPESCDGLDSDCNGSIVDGFADANTDGVPDCVQPVNNDYDEDGVDNDVDNCPYASNQDQADLDKDKKGDVCDTDQDGDGVDNTQDCNDRDSSISALVIYYQDQDGDGVGDSASQTRACSSTAPEGYLATGGDNCPAASNADQADSDSDGWGDVCDTETLGSGTVHGGTGCSIGAGSSGGTGTSMLVFGMALLPLAWRRRRHSR